MSQATWTIVSSRQAQKDAVKLAVSGLKQRAKRLLEVLATDPLATPPRDETLVSDLAGGCTWRINIQYDSSMRSSRKTTWCTCSAYGRTTRRQSAMGRRRGAAVPRSLTHQSTRALLSELVVGTGEVADE